MKIAFVEKRKIFFAISIVIIILGIIGVVIVGGPILSIDYQGGATIDIGMPNNDYSLTEVEELLKDLTGKSVTVQKSESDYNTYRQNENVLNNTVILDIRIQTKEQLTSEETRKVSNYLKEKYSSIEVPAPSYHEASSPYVALYQIPCKEIKAETGSEFDSVMKTIQEDIAALLKTDAETKKVDTDFSYIYTKQSADTATVKKYFLNISIASSDEMITEADRLDIKNAIGEKFDIVVSENPVDFNYSTISPSVGREMLKNGLLAIAIASVLMIIYIWFRFRTVSGLSAGVMAVIALLHDVIIMFLVYCIFRYTINEQFIAAVLTILGYSINNTIVVFDRVRENINLDSKVSIKNIVNTSLNQTLKRCLITSSCVFVSLVILFGFSAFNNLSSVVEFAFPLMIGTVSGFFSSTFIAPNLWVMYKEKKEK